MKITGVEMRTIRMPLKSPFETSFGVETGAGGGAAPGARLGRPDRDQHPVDVQGWGECVAMEAPLYSSEYADGAADVLRRFLVPRLLDHVKDTGDVTAEQIDAAAGTDHRASDGQGRPGDGRARCAVARDRAVVRRIPGRDAATGAVRGFGGYPAVVTALLEVVGDYLAQGYVRIKLKIKPGWDVAPVEAVREHFGELIPLQVDANAAYTLADARTLARLDAFDLLLIEQPLPEDDIRQHAELAKLIRTPICLDESVVSVRAAADVIALRAAQVINIKAGRVGGYLNARRIHDLCQANGIPVWCGGMVETGLGRAANAALAALPGLHPAR